MTMWLRRNRWGLIGLLPAVAALLLLHARQVRTAEDAAPVLAVGATVDGWYPILNHRVRLSTMDRATGLRTTDRRAFTPPAHVVIWHTAIEFDAVDETNLSNCRIALEDRFGRTYDAGPDLELAGAAGAASQGCQRTGIVGDTRYTNAQFFALPEQIDPVAVRITVPGFLPNYVRLPLPGN